MKSTRLIILVLAAVVCVTSAASTFNPTLNESIAATVEDLHVLCLQNPTLPEVFHEVTGTAYYHFTMCLAEHVNQCQLERDLRALNSSTRVRFFDQHCPPLMETLACFQPIADAISDCWNSWNVVPKEVTIFKTVVSLLPEARERLCEGHGKVLFKQVDFSIEQCKEDLKNCDSKMSNVKNVKSLSDLNDARCRDVTEARECISSVLNGCNASGLMDLIDLFYEPIVRVTPCARDKN